MLDYCPGASRQAVERSCIILTARLRKPIFTLSWQGCLWIVSYPRLAARVQCILAPAGDTPEAWLIDFCQSNALSRPCVRPVQDEQVRGGTQHAVPR